MWVIGLAYIVFWMSKSNLILVTWLYNLIISLAMRGGCWIWFWNQEEPMFRPQSVSLLSKELASSSVASVFFQESYQIHDWSHGMFRCRFTPTSEELVFFLYRLRMESRYFICELSNNNFTNFFLMNNFAFFSNPPMRKLKNF